MARPDSADNHAVAEKLREAADLLEQQGANPFRVGAYRRAAQTVAQLDEDLWRRLESQGIEGLTALPDIGQGIASAIAEILRTGRWAQLERLRGTLDPVRLFQTVPGIGPALARRIHETLHVDTLEALELAAHDGSLESVPGVGRRRAAAIRAVLESMLGRVRRARTPSRPHVPQAHMVLDVDAEYRDKAASGELPAIAPKRFNPTGEAWLPILHTSRDGWHFTALFSNTARAHELERTQDWVVVYFYDDDHHREGQHTVVTETRGPLTGRRVIRGREAECRALLADSETAKAQP
ncbi:DNA-binding protein [Ectothiorhodospiraceae bacterium WFHF3C12]|nr:DNA-binding protein [Ectothiorhodospiraceae bacterium WFHF3C12]